jgi:hypothetical protein
LKLRITALTLPTSLVAELDALAAALGVTRSKLVRYALSEWLGQRDQAQTAVDEDAHVISEDEPQIVADLASRMEQSTLRRMERAGPRQRRVIEEAARLAAPLSRFLAHCRSGIAPTHQDAAWFCDVSDALRVMLNTEFGDALENTVIGNIAFTATRFADWLHTQLYPNNDAEVVRDAGAPDSAR